MATHYRKTSLTGGTVGALDGINGNSLVSGDVAYVLDVNNNFSVYECTTGGAAESAPFIIVPDSNPGSWNWRLHTAGGGPLMPTYNVMISSSNITAVGSGRYIINTESSAATDNLKKITGLNKGNRATLICTTSNHVVVLKNSVNLRLQADFTLQSKYDRLEVECATTDNVCVEMSRSQWETT